jgi:hypothetical protein
VLALWRARGRIATLRLVVPLGDRQGNGSEELMHRIFSRRSPAMVAGGIMTEGSSSDGCTGTTPGDDLQIFQPRITAVAGSAS